MDNTLSKYYHIIAALAATLLLVFALTAYSKNLPQLGFFGLIFLGMTTLGYFTWLINVKVFGDDEEPYSSQLILAGAAITFGLFGASVLIGIASNQYSFLASLQLGQGILAPLSSAVIDPSAATLTFIMNIPGPIAEEAFFRVFLCTAFILGFGGGDLKTTNLNVFHKCLIVAVSSGSFGFFHWYAYNANFGQIIAAIAAGVILAGYYVFVQRSVLVVTAGHFAYNFAILLMGLAGTLGLSLAPAVTPLLAVIPLLLTVRFCHVYKLTSFKRLGTKLSFLQEVL